VAARERAIRLVPGWHDGSNTAYARSLWVPKSLSHHAACEYSWISPRRAGPAQNTYTGHVGGRLRATGGRAR